jgi:hypothetical protein
MHLPRFAPRKTVGIATTAVASCAIVVAVGGSALAPAQGEAQAPATTTTAPPNVIPPEAARVVGEPVVFRLTTTQSSGVAFIVVARMTKRLKLMNADINGYGSDGEQSPLLKRTSSTCYRTTYSGFGKRRNGRIIWSIPASVADLEAGSTADVTILDTSNDNWYDVSQPLPTDQTFKVRIRSPRGPLRTKTGQYSLRNKLAQRRLKAIGCSGRFARGALQY